MQCLEKEPTSLVLLNVFDVEFRARIGGWQLRRRSKRHRRKVGTWFDRSNQRLVGRFTKYTKRYSLASRWSQHAPCQKRLTIHVLVNSCSSVELSKNK